MSLKKIDRNAFATANTEEKHLKWNSNMTQRGVLHGFPYSPMVCFSSSACYSEITLCLGQGSGHSHHIALNLKASGTWAVYMGSLSIVLV